MTQEDLHRMLESAGLAAVAAVNYFVANYNAIAGNILVTLSVGYMIWKWRRDIKKNKARKNDL